MGRAAHLMTDTVTKAPNSGEDNAGDPTYGAQSKIKARVEYRSKILIDASGNQVEADGRVISESEILVSDRLWLPDDDETKTNEARRPIKVDKLSTPDGYTQYEAWFR